VLAAPPRGRGRAAAGTALGQILCVCARVRVHVRVCYAPARTAAVVGPGCGRLVWELPGKAPCRHKWGSGAGGRLVVRAAVLCHAAAFAVARTTAASGGHRGVEEEVAHRGRAAATAPAPGSGG